MPQRPLRRTERSRARRKPERARYDWDTATSILDEALICHVGVAVDDQPLVMPMAFGRIGGHLYLHGAAANATLRALAGGSPACITITLLDGLVLARSAFHHSMNYRSIVLFGRLERVTDDEEKRAALLAIVDHMVSGRSGETRPPTALELRTTLVVRLEIDEGSAKVRTGGPVEEPDDLGLAHWAGVIPLAVVRGEPQPDEPDISEGAMPGP